MFKLEVFGNPQLKFIDTNQHQEKAFSTALPLLITAYVIVEHQGEAKREKVYDLFFPMAPIFPEHFSESSKMIYEKLWESGKSGQQSSIVRIAWDELKKFSDSGNRKEKSPPAPLYESGEFSPLKKGDRGDLFFPTPSEVESACEELKNYSVIEYYQLKDDGLNCWLTSQFKNYLSDFRNDDQAAIVCDEKDKKLKNHSKCSEYIRTIKIFVKQFVHDTNKVDDIFPQGQRGKKGNPSFIIRIDCNVTELKQALADNDFAQIKAIYRGVFLADIENKVRTNVWLSPNLRDWIQNKRQDFAQQVSHTLLNIIGDFKQSADNERVALIKDIQTFCVQCELKDESLRQAINELLAPSHLSNSENSNPNVPELSLPQPIHNSPENPSLPHPIRDHLLAKMGDACHIQLRTVNQWINTQVLLERLHLKDAFPIQDSRGIFQRLFEQSYGFMILLGEAGMGKSLVLYHLAQQLIIEAKKDANKPIPLIFHLADWAMQSLSFEEWLKHELIQFGLAEKDIETDFDLLLIHKHCVFLLDGFDNLLSQQHVSHLKTINGFIQKHGEPNLGGIIIASRPDEYHLAKKRLLETSTVAHRFYAEATIQALSVDESRRYIIAHTSPYRLPLDTLFESKAFRQLLNTPLGLILFVENAKSHPIDGHTETDFNTIKNHLISTYVHNCFKRAECYYQEKRQKLPYTELEVKTWLGHLACSMNIGGAFSVEGLSPIQMLTKKQQYYYQWWFSVIFGLTFGLMMGSVAGLIFGKRVSNYASDGKQIMLPDAFMGIHQTLIEWINNDAFISKIELVISYASIGMVSALLMSCIAFFLPMVFQNNKFPNTPLTPSIWGISCEQSPLDRGCKDGYYFYKRIKFSIFLGGYLSLSLGMTGWLVDGSQWALFVIIFYGILGILLGLLINPEHTNALTIELHQDTRLSYERLFEQWRNIIWGGLLIPVSMSLMAVFSLFLPKLTLGVALLQGFALGVSFTIGYTFYRLKTQSDWQKKDFLPRQKIKAALKRSLLMTFIIGGLITFLITGLGASHLGWPGNLSFGLRLGMPIGIIFGFMFYGGIEVLKHITLRLAMYQYRIAPWHYTRFLEYAKLLMFLKPQSGGYAFRHDWFQEYFKKDM